MKIDTSKGHPELGRNQELEPHCAQAREKERRLTEGAVRFEGYFVTEMLKQMRRSTAVLAGPDSALNDRVNGDMLDFADQALGDVLAGQRAFGIADALIRQLLPAGHASVCAAAPGAPTEPASGANGISIPNPKNPT